MRLIDADAATERAKEPTIYDLEDVPYFLEECPTIDAELVRHGHWIRSGVITGKCSECGEISADRGKYCSNCGAKMDGESDEKDKDNDNG